MGKITKRLKKKKGVCVEKDEDNILNKRVNKAVFVTYHDYSPHTETKHYLSGLAFVKQEDFSCLKKKKCSTHEKQQEQSSSLAEVLPTGS